MIGGDFIIVDIILWLIYITGAIALAVVAWSLLRTLRNHSRRGIINGIRSSLIAWSVAGLLALSLAITWLTGSEKPMLINGLVYDNGTWLRIADMLVNTIAIMLVAAIIAVAFGFTRYYRRKRKEAAK